MQDMEFTIENGKLYMLQTRNGKRTAAAALKIAVRPRRRGHDLPRRGRHARGAEAARFPAAPAVRRRRAEGRRGRRQGPGRLSGRCLRPVLSSPPRTPKSWAANGEKVVLVRLETCPEDIEGMAAAQGILTVRGGMTSHAAVVARGMGTCCVSGCGEITMRRGSRSTSPSPARTYHEGDWISIDGSTGNIYGCADQDRRGHHQRQL